MKTKFLRIGKRTISVILSIMMVVSVMLVGMVSVSAWTSLYIIGGPAGNNWSTNNTSCPFNKWYDSNDGNSGRYYQEITLTNGQYFALSLGSGNRLAPSTTSDLKSGVSAIQVFQANTDNSFRYTGTTGKVRVCIDQKSGGDTSPYVWIEEIGNPTYDTYTVVGTSNFCGSNWNETDTKNDMSTSNGTVYTKTYNNLDSGDYEFKIVKSHSWDTSYGHNSNTTYSGDNISVSNAEGNVKFQLRATSNVTIKFEPTNNKITVIATSTSTPTTVTITSGGVGYKSGSTWTALTGNLTIGGTSVAANGTKSATSGSAIAISAPSINNYTFSTWECNDGSGTFANANNASTTFTPSSDATIRAVYTSGSVVDPDDDEETGTATGYYLNEATSSSDTSFKKDKNFKHYTNDDANVYYLTTFLTEGQYISVTNPNGNNFYGGGSIDINNSDYTFHQYGDTTIQHAEFTGASGLYKIKLTVNGDSCKLYITPGGKSVAKKDLTLTIKENGSSDAAGTSLELVEDRAIENGVLLTTTFTSNVAAAATKQVTYYFNYLDEDGKPLTTQPLEYKAEIGETSITHNYVVKTADDNEYTVEVSTTENYIYSTGTELGYLSAKSGEVTLNVKPTPLYIIPVKAGVLDFANSKEITTEAPYEFTLTSTATTLASSTFILSSVKVEAQISEVLVKSYDPDDSRTAYSAIEKGKMQVGEEFFTTYTISPNHYCSNPVLYLDKSGAQPVIYSVAKYTKNVTNTKDNKTEKVTYYFAEPTGAQDISKSGAGLKIAYWNNSIDEIQIMSYNKGNKYLNGDLTNAKIKAASCTDVTTKVNVKVNGTDTNQIYVKTNQLYDLSGSGDGDKTFYIYSVDLPIWATSFAFMNGDDVIWTKSINGADTHYSSIQLNPNRVYLLYKYDNKTYCKGVVLDNSLWQSGRSSNEPGIKTFKSNAVNYRTEYNDDGTLSNAFNTRIKDRYYSSYPNPLYFGYFDKGTGDNANGLTGFEIENNLAMRNGSEDDERYYFASVQNLVHPVLSDTDKNANGYGYLRGANGVNMPLFDYDELKKDNEKYKNDATNKPLANIVAEGADFPFYESEFNGVKTYSYDSTTDKNRRYNPSTGTFDIDTTTHGYRNATLGGTKGIGYFPFGLDDYDNAYGFATEFDIDFYMSNTGYLTSSTGKEDIAFNFSGDDDVWVFIDGILVLDLGGAHKASSGTINLSDMKVYYKTAAKDTDSVKNIHDGFAISSSCVNTVDLAEIFAANGKKFNNTDASTKHTLQMFYMERGSFDSNCSISFNLPQNNGVLVQNNVDFKKVNAGLLEVTKDVANRDYFSYYIGGKYANETEYEYAKALANNSTLPHFVHGNSAATDGYYTNLFSTIYAPDIPKYPLYSNNSVVRRVINNKTYILLREGRTDGQSSIDAGTYETAFKTASDAKIFYGFNALNYSLGDAQAKAESNTTTIDLSTAVSGRTDNGKFPLLFGQSAQFTSKIPANALVQVYQENDLYKVTIPKDSNGNDIEVTKGDKYSNRDVKSYYTTAYEILDDKSQKTIGSRADAINDGNPIYADDKTDIENAFYYSNYSGISSTTAYAMTVNYTNSVAVGDIKITKKLKDGQIPNSDKFYFTVKFSNIFGDSENYSEMLEYRDLEYTVYDADGSNPSTYTYSVAGIALKAGQYAVISGVPVGTKYEIVENSKLGYTFDSMKATVTAGGNTLAVDDTSIIPTVDESKSTTSTVVVDVVNSQSAFEIVLKYYDREIVDGRPAHISKTPTVFKYSLDQTQVDNECEKDGQGNVTSVDFAGLISIAEGANKISNVVDKYTLWTSNKDAIDAIGNKKRTKYDAKKYSELYDSSTLAYHTSYIGTYVDADYADESSDELWVTYYDIKGNPIPESELGTRFNEVVKIQAWYFNELRPYEVITYDATNVDKNSDGNYVGIAQKKSYDFYYNERFGSGDNDDSTLINSPGAYLAAYGIQKPYIDEYPTTPEKIKVDDEELEFLYWAYDPEGEMVASTDMEYGYRVTNTYELYPVYGTAGLTPGLTVTKNENDVYFDKNGTSMTRLNVMFNPYGCKQNDTNIQKASIIYLVVPESFTVTGSGVDNHYQTTVDTIKDTFVDGNYELGRNQMSVDGVNFANSANKANVYVYNVTFNRPTDDDPVAAEDVVLTNKNRVQFTSTYTTSKLAGKRIIALAAMEYKNPETGEIEWIFSDNYVEYTF